MAKLKAHGYELARATKEGEGRIGETSMERTEYALMEDGYVLQKRTVRFVPTSTYDPPEGRLYTWGWKIKGKMKDRKTSTAEELRERFRKWLEPNGFTVLLETRDHGHPWKPRVATVAQ